MVKFDSRTSLFNIHPCTLDVGWILSQSAHALPGNINWYLWTN